MSNFDRTVIEIESLVDNLCLQAKDEANAELFQITTDAVMCTRAECVAGMCTVWISEADPDNSSFHEYIQDGLFQEGFLDVKVVTEW